MTDPTLRGTISWPGFGPNGEDYFGFLFLVENVDGEPFDENEEGPLDWHPLDTLEELPMWDGDRFMLPLLFDDDPTLFHLVIPYEQGRPTGCTVVRGSSISSIVVDPPS